MVASLEACLEAATEAGLTVVEASSPPKAREGAEVVVTMVVASSVAVARAAAGRAGADQQGPARERARRRWPSCGWAG